jgi:D-beta-D-heptose 7-phosphate kinase/D-beta-D-heptose 1-phosphate adenosyltransferase
MLNVAKLGGDVRAFGFTGDDSKGKRLKSLLKDNGIDDTSVITDAERMTTEKQRIVAGGQQLVRIDFEDNFQAGPEIKKQLVSCLKDTIESGSLDAVIFEDYAKGAIDRDMLRDVAEVAAEAGVMTALDPHVRQLLEVPGLTLLKPNRVEAFALAGVYCRDAVDPPENDDALRRVAEKLFSRWSPRYLLISLGAQGLALFEKGGEFHFIPTKAKEVYDVSGAGDTVMSAFMLSLTGGATGREAAVVANNAAGIVVGKAGTATVTAEELRESFDYD